VVVVTDTYAIILPKCLDLFRVDSLMLRKRTKTYIMSPLWGLTLILVHYYKHLAPIGALEIGVVSVKVH
jgi:hypothetical protein